MPFLLWVSLLATNSPILSVEISTTTPQQVWAETLHQCENPDDVPRVWDSNNQWSYGKYQWQMRSWLNYKKQGATKENIGDEDMQDKITLYVLETKGWSDWWTCGRRVEKKLGPFPAS